MSIHTKHNINYYFESPDEKIYYLIKDFHNNSLQFSSKKLIDDIFNILRKKKISNRKSPLKISPGKGIGKKASPTFNNYLIRKLIRIITTIDQYELIKKGRKNYIYVHNCQYKHYFMNLKFWNVYREFSCNSLFSYLFKLNNDDKEFLRCNCIEILSHTSLFRNNINLILKFKSLPEIQKDFNIFFEYNNEYNFVKTLKNIFYDHECNHKYIRKINGVNVKFTGHLKN